MPSVWQYGGEGNEYCEDGVSSTCVLEGGDAASRTREEEHLSRTQPRRGDIPIIVYTVISDVPALSADGTELERRIMVRIHILTKDGRFREIHKAVKSVLLPLGFVRAQTQELTEKDIFVEITDYRTAMAVS